MNSSGWIRGLMSKSFSPDDYIQHVFKTLSKEFGIDGTIFIGTEEYLLEFDDILIRLNKGQCKQPKIEVLTRSTK